MRKALQRTRARCKRMLDPEAGRTERQLRMILGVLIESIDEGDTEAVEYIAKMWNRDDDPERWMLHALGRRWP